MWSWLSSGFSGGKNFPALGPSGRQNLPSALGAHSGSEAVNPGAGDLLWLKCHFAHGVFPF